MSTPLAVLNPTLGHLMPRDRPDDYVVPATCANRSCSNEITMLWGDRRSAARFCPTHDYTAINAARLANIAEAETHVSVFGYDEYTEGTSVPVSVIMDDTQFEVMEVSQSGKRLKISTGAAVWADEVWVNFG